MELNGKLEKSNSVLLIRQESGKVVEALISLFKISLEYSLTIEAVVTLNGNCEASSGGNVRVVFVETTCKSFSFATATFNWMLGPVLG